MNTAEITLPEGWEAMNVDALEASIASIDTTDRTDVPLAPVVYDRRQTSTVWPCLTPRERITERWEVS